MWCTLSFFLRYQTTRSVQSKRERGVQMARPDLLLDDRRDYTLEPRPYFSALQVRRCAGEERGGGRCEKKRKEKGLLPF